MGVGRDRVLVVTLVSGGRDGELAARMLERQGVDVVRVHLDTGFARADRRRALGLAVAPDPIGGSEPPGPGRAVEVVDVRRDYLRDVVAVGSRGHGTGLDACVECRTFLVRRAFALARDLGAEAVATGEVVGQHPRSQSREALARIANGSGDFDRLVRPLSAKRLPATAPEREGRIDRERLGDAHGRGRTAQRAWGAAWGVSDGPQAGGNCCLLADPAFARRIRDLLAHVRAEDVRSEDLDRLRVGRHFRLDHGAKAIVARDADECDWLRRAAGADEWLAALAAGPGTTVLVEGRAPSAAALRRAAELVVRFSATHAHAVAEVVLNRGDERRTVAVEAADERFLVAARV